MKTVYHFPRGEPFQVEGLCLSFLLRAHNDQGKAAIQLPQAFCKPSGNYRKLVNLSEAGYRNTTNSECGASDCGGRGNRTEHKQEAKHTVTDCREWGTKKPRWQVSE